MFEVCLILVLWCLLVDGVQFPIVQVTAITGGANLEAWHPQLGPNRWPIFLKDGFFWMPFYQF